MGRHTCPSNGTVVCSCILMHWFPHVEQDFVLSLQQDTACEQQSIRMPCEWSLAVHALQSKQGFLAKQTRNAKTGCLDHVCCSIERMIEMFRLSLWLQTLYEPMGQPTTSSGRFGNGDGPELSTAAIACNISIRETQCQG